MRRSILLLPFAFALAIPSGEASAKSVQQEFSQAWTERGERYEAEQLRLNARVDEAWKALDEARKANAPDVKDRTGQFISTLQDGAYLHGLAALLYAFKEHMAKKPSAAATELWVQERVDSLRTQAEVLDKTGEHLKSDTSPGAFKAKLAALANSAEFMGTVAELRLLDGQCLLGEIDAGRAEPLCAEHIEAAKNNRRDDRADQHESACLAAS